MTTTAICKAKDPNSCPYHGAVLRMYAAQDTGDVQAYFEARTIVEAKEKEKWVEENFAEAINIGTLDNDEIKIVSSKDMSNVNFTFFPDSIRSYSLEDPDDDDDGIVFHRSSSNNHDFPYFIRIQANRELKAEDVEKFASLLGYAYKQTVAGESLGWPVRDTKSSFYVHADTTKGRTDDIGFALTKMEEIYSGYVDDGTPPRVRSNNTRAVDGFNEPELNFEVYYG